jgi:hypothetical protein
VTVTFLSLLEDPSVASLLTLPSKCTGQVKEPHDATHNSKITHDSNRVAQVKVRTGKNLANGFEAPRNDVAETLI